MDRRIGITTSCYTIQLAAICIRGIRVGNNIRYLKKVPAAMFRIKPDQIPSENNAPG